jgi:glycosyltransferase involved in cell wall biosynthesis
LVAKGIDVTLFATADSITKGRLHAVCKGGYEEDRQVEPKVWECLHISELFEKADEFDLIHNHFDFLPLTYSQLVTTPVVTTIHGFSSPRILPVYEKYNRKVFYVAISESDRSPNLNYIATIHHGIDLDDFTDDFTFVPEPEDSLLFFGRIHPDKGAKEAIEIARAAGKKLTMAGVIQDETYFASEVKPHIDGDDVTYVGSVGPEQRDELLGKAFALLHPISFDEPFGLSIIEAMCCGTPVIAFNRGSMPELIMHGVNGFLVSHVEEAVESVKELCKIDRLACRRFVEENFSTERMVNDYLKVYEQILELTKREDHRPWGYYTVLSDEPDHKVKRIVVYPGKRLSLQQHRRRSIPAGAAHRMENPTSDNIAFIEVQTGDYFGEDDIIRIDDDFGRT